MSLLQQRIVRTTEAAEIRRLQLRISVLLDSNLGRVDEARDVLEGLLADNGEDVSVLRMLANSWQRSNEPSKAAHYWQLVLSLSDDVQERSDAALHAAHAHVLGEEWAQARLAVKQVEFVDINSLKLQLTIAQGAEDLELKRTALISLAEQEDLESSQAGEYYLQAAQLTRSLGEDVEAERLVQLCMRHLPERAEACLLAAELIAQLHPLQSREVAQKQLELLRRTIGLMQLRDRSVRTVLLAAALALTESEAVAEEALSQALQECSRAPVVLVALARLKINDPVAALKLYEEAIGGDFYGIFESAQLLLEAGELAEKYEKYVQARRFYSAVSNSDPKRRLLADERLEALMKRVSRAAPQSVMPSDLTFDEVRELKQQQSALAELKNAEAQSASIRAATEKSAAELAEQEFAKLRNRALFEADSEVAALRAQELAKDATEQAERLAREATDKLKAAQAAQALVRAAEDSLRMEPEHGDGLAVATAARAAQAMQAAAAAAVPPLSADQAKAVALEPIDHRITPRIPMSDARAAALTAIHPTPRIELPEDKSLEPLAATTAAMRFEPVPSPMKPTLELAPDSESPSGASSPSWASCISNRNEGQLVKSFEQGDNDAGRELLDRLLVQQGRARDAGIVAQHLASALPGDISVLSRMITLASREGNQSLNRALRHVLGCYDAGETIVAPDFQELDAQADYVKSVLWQGVRSGSSEAMHIIWEGAHSLFQRSLQDYGLSGEQRVSLSAHTPLGHLYKGAAGLLGMGRAGLFADRKGDVVSMKVGLLREPIVILSGQVNQITPEFMFHFGAMIAAAAPEHALLYGVAPGEMKKFLQAVRLGFGSAEGRNSNPDPEISKLAATLWDLMPGRSQRRLTEICKTPKLVNLRAVSEHSRLVLRRAGLLVSGDLKVAVADAAREARLVPPTTMDELSTCARASPLVADLLSVAVSQEYAEVRFRQLPQRRSMT